MTGYGRGVAEGGGFTAQVELRSVNHRFLEIRVRGLGSLPQLSRRSEQELRGRFARGALELSVRWQKEGEVQPKQLNFSAARRYTQNLRALSAVLGTGEPPQLDHLIRLGVFEEEQPDLESLWAPLSAAVGEACAELAESRAVEGRRTAEALQRELSSLGPLVDRARELAVEEREGAEARLRERLHRVDVDADPGRLEMELAVWAERGDVQEELDRLGAHVERLQEMMARAGPVGRELEFLAQEVGREAGTVGAKARGKDLSRVALELRVAAERIREQARNVE